MSKGSRFYVALNKLSMKKLVFTSISKELILLSKYFLIFKFKFILSYPHILKVLIIKFINLNLNLLLLGAVFSVEYVILYSIINILGCG